MSSETLHAPRERLSRSTLLLHHALVSVIEELEAIDWYRQRADDTEDEALKELLLHNMREEMEHASMVLEWIRRHDTDFAGHLKTYLFTEKPILEIEEAKTEAKASAPTAKPRRTLTIGSLREG
jgi:ferritin-like protein